ncbi:UDP-glucose 4-epimerase GalE [Roseibium sp. M-1]
MTVLITGGAGYIGSHTVLNFLDAGETPVIVDNLTTGFDWLVPEGVPLHVADIGDKNSISALMRQYGIETVIHFAGSIIVPESVENPLKYYRNNTANTQVLLEACVENGVKHFLFSSTAAVYGDPELIPVPEDAALAPLSPYGTSKLMTEFMLRDVAAAHDLTYTALRYFNVAGADPRGRSGQATANATHLIKVACETALGKRDSMSVFGRDYDTPDGTAIRDYIHVSDLATAHRLAVERLRRGGESAVMNCGYGRGFSVLDVIRAVKKVSGVDFDVVDAPRRAGDSPKVVADSGRARSELDWRPENDDLEQIVRNALSWEDSLSRRNRI